MLLFPLSPFGVYPEVILLASKAYLLSFPFPCSDNAWGIAQKVNNSCLMHSVIPVKFRPQNNVVRPRNWLTVVLSRMQTPVSWGKVLFSDPSPLLAISHYVMYTGLCHLFKLSKTDAIGFKLQAKGHLVCLHLTPRVVTKNRFH